MSRPPDLILKMMDKSLDLKSGRIGCAWVNPDGSVTLSVDWPHVISGDNKNIVYTLFPANTDSPPAKAKKA